VRMVTSVFIERR